MSENNVWRCTWEQRGVKVTIRVENKKRALTVTEPTLDRAIGAMQNAICGAFGDGEATLDPDPPFPPYIQSRLADYSTHVRLGGNGSYTLLPSAKPLWEKEPCKSCRRIVTPRSAEPLRIRVEAPGEMVFPCGKSARVNSFVISERLLAALTPQERAAFEVRSVVTERRTLWEQRRRYVELVCTRVVSGVWPRDLETKATRCGVCGNTLFTDRPDIEFARTDTAASKTIIGYYNFGHVSLLCGIARWRQLRDQGLTHQVTASIVGLVPERDCLSQADIDKIVVVYRRTPQDDEADRQRMLDLLRKTAEEVGIDFDKISRKPPR